MKVLVAGSVNADDTVRVARLPRGGETSSARSLTTGLGGKGANQAIAAARAGATVTMTGAVGAADSEPLLAELASAGVEVQGIARVEGVRTGRAIVLVDDAAENSIVLLPGANGAVPDAAVERACAALLPGDVLVLQNEVPIATSRRAAGLARAAGAVVLWNAAPAPESADRLLRDLDVLVVNEHELGAVAAALHLPDEGIDATAAAVAAELGADVVCTLGAAGAAYRTGSESGRVPARRVQAVDTTGAGDTFVGYLAAGGGRPTSEVLRTALAAATLAVTRPGAAASIPTVSEVEPDLGAQTTRSSR